MEIRKLIQYNMNMHNKSFLKLKHLFYQIFIFYSNQILYFFLKFLLTVVFNRAIYKISILFIV